jgi:hypothetical protein
MPEATFNRPKTSPRQAAQRHEGDKRVNQSIPSRVGAVPDLIDAAVTGRFVSIRWQ